MPQPIECKNCIFFRYNGLPDGGEMLRGKCKRFPPQPNPREPVGPADEFLQPKVRLVDSCGEHKPGSIDVSKISDRFEKCLLTLDSRVIEAIVMGLVVVSIDDLASVSTKTWHQFRERWPQEFPAVMKWVSDNDFTIQRV